MNEQSSSSNRNILIGVVVIVVLVAGFLLFSNSQNTSSPEPTTTPTTQDTASPSATVSEVVVNLSEQNSSKESGTATLREVDGKVVVTLNMTGAPEGVAPQPAHIHVGACPNVGTVKYPLTNVMNGTSETTLGVTLDQLRSELPLGINVHKSQPEASVYVSCGDLKL